MEIGKLEKGKVTFYNLDGEEIEKELVEIKWEQKPQKKADLNIL